MTNRKSKLALGLTGASLALALLGIVSCTPCPNCSPVLTCTHTGCGSAKVSTPESGPDCAAEDSGAPVALVSHHKPCTTHSQCTAGEHPGEGYGCTTLIGLCDTAAGRCVARLASSSYQCAEGSVRKCVTLNGTDGVIACDPALCNWATPGDPTRGCRECGDVGQPCCLGGCRPGNRCSDFTGSATAVCNRITPT